MFFVETLLAYLKVWLVQFVYEVSNYCPGNFDIWSKTASKLFQTSEEQRTRSAPSGGPDRSKGVPLRGAEKQVATQKNALPWESFNQLAPQ